MMQTNVIICGQINTGIKFFGQKILIESTGDRRTDRAFKETFCEMYGLSGPPPTRMTDVKRLMSYSIYTKNITGAERKRGQLLRLINNADQPDNMRFSP